MVYFGNVLCRVPACIIACRNYSSQLVRRHQRAYIGYNGSALPYQTRINCERGLVVHAVPIWAPNDGAGCVSRYMRF